ncbi:Rrf2 family transcriptional regulator [Scytonema hofmannii PCC 7110]|uniref:Rrf2 family transcriptional regulator n=1 Tax=Scytonema hofmannii PCC 7110 TaxID=128403 RepID=A0A139XAB7_9CYAN|nr:Rrf2 family transcriptional regulator [Scytonema hofmannii]KYC41631.1 Rrf2 family transcriptional regulator [Scytonema hofmannii PCC 7110]
MELSNKTEYAILSLLALAKCYADGESLQIREIAARQNIPNRYLEELLATLRRGGLIKSIRGVKGGYVLAREPQKITVLEALRCIEGLDDEPGKPSNIKTVETEVIRDVWQEVRQAAYDVLQKHTLQDLCEQRISKRQMELMYYI